MATSGSYFASSSSIQAAEDTKPSVSDPPPPEGWDAPRHFIERQQAVYSHGPLSNAGNDYLRSTVYNVTYTFDGPLELVSTSDGPLDQQIPPILPQELLHGKLPVQQTRTSPMVPRPENGDFAVRSPNYRENGTSPSVDSGSITYVDSTSASSLSGPEAGSTPSLLSPSTESDSQRTRISQSSSATKYEYDMTYELHGSVSEQKGGKKKATTQEQDVLAQAKIPKNLFNPPPRLPQVEEYTALLSVHPDCYTLIALWSPTQVPQSTYVNSPANNIVPFPLGNVGFLTPEGRFYELFNVFLTEEQNRERGCITPPDFTPFKGTPQLEPINLRRRDAVPFRSGVAIARASGSVIILRGEKADNPNHPLPRSYVCKLSQDPTDTNPDTGLAGAAMILPQGAGIVQLSPDTLGCLRNGYLRHVFPAFLAHCHERREDSRKASLMLVTEACFTNSWAAMSYVEPRPISSRVRTNPKDFELPATPLDRQGKFYKWDEHTPPGSLTKTERNVFDTPQDVARDGLCVAIGGFLMRYHRHKPSNWHRSRHDWMAQKPKSAASKSSSSASTIVLIGKRLASFNFFGKSSKKKL